MHAGNRRGGEKQAYLLQEGKEWREKVKKEKKKKKPGVILPSKKKSGDRTFFLEMLSAAQRDVWLQCVAMCVQTGAHKAKGIVVKLLVGGWGRKMRTIRGCLGSRGRTLLAQASSSHVVSCKTLMISLISALIFSKVNFRFLSASSTPAPLLLFVVTKIFMAEQQKHKSTITGHSRRN